MIFRVLALIFTTTTFSFTPLALAGAQQTALTDAQVAEAIALGKSGACVPTVHVGASHDFDVFIDGPVARVAKAAARASKKFQPFDVKDVTGALKTSDDVVTVLSTSNGRYLAARHIVLQPKGVDGVIQPIAEDGDVDSVLVGRQATFDLLPDGEFDIVVATLDGGEQRFTVTAKQRAEIR